MYDSVTQKVLVIDDHPFIRSSIIKELESDDGYRVCGEAGTASEAKKLLQLMEPDYVILDISLEEGTGIEILEFIQSHNMKCQPIVVSMHEEPAYIEQALQGGARGYIFKRESVQSVLEALQQVRAGKVFMSQRVAKVLIQQHHKDENSTNLDKILSERELEIFSRIGNGNTRSQVAEELYISVRTVDSHLERIKTKLNCTRMAQVTRLALQYQLSKVTH